MRGRVRRQQRADLERLAAVVRPEDVVDDEHLPSCSVPMRTLSPLREASESDQLSARVRSSLPSR